MRVNRVINIGRVPTSREMSKPEPINKWATVLDKGIIEAHELITTALNGRLGFGSGQSGSGADNFAGVVKDVITGAANVEVSVVHDLGVVPIGFLLIVPPVDGFVNRGVTPWTTSVMYLKCSAGTQNMRVVILAPSQMQ